MTQFTVGKEVLSYCGKCKLPLAHTIVSMKDESTIAKVECKTCGATHMYKDPATKAKKVKSKSMIPGAKAKSISIAEHWAQTMNKTHSKPRKYSIKELYEVGDIIDHKKFGPGIVEGLIDGKIEVLFQHSQKLLVHNIK